MAKKPSFQRKNKSGTRKRQLQFAEVSFDNSSDLGSVMIPVMSRNISKRRRAQIVAEAQEFHRKGLYIQKCTNPTFLRALAKDFFDILCTLHPQRYVAGQFAQYAIANYFDRIEQALTTDRVGTLRRTHEFLSVRAKNSRLGSKQEEFVATFREDYAENVVSEVSKLLDPLFKKPARNKRANFWLMFTTWIWTNQMANAMQDLEERIGTQALEKMTSERLFPEVLRTYEKDATAATELARLTEYYLGEFAKMLLEPIYSLPLEQLELLLLLRRKRSGRLVILADWGVQIDRVLKQPQEIYSVPPRRFEELMAFALSKSGYDDVQLTPQTRDGGYDIEAIRDGPTRHRLIVECKRYEHGRKVGRPILDALLGVLDRENANQALLATTSSFSQEALKLFKHEPWRLQGMDIEKILQLLRQARRN